MRILVLSLVILAFTACQSGGSGSSSNGASSDWKSMEMKVTKNNRDQKVSEGYTDAAGVAQGPQLDFHPRKGLVKSMVNYVDGKKNGPYLEMTETGNVLEKSWYVDDVLQGERTVFNRTRVKEESVYKDGQLHGDRKLYYDNGKIQEEGTFKDGKRNGVAKWYNQDEEITIQYEYKNGEKVREIPIGEN